MDFKVLSVDGIPIWRVTGIYGWLGNCDKYLTWELLLKLKEESNLPYLVPGDLNDILFCGNKQGKAPPKFSVYA